MKNKIEEPDHYAPHNSLPGEVVMQHRNGLDGSPWSFEFTVRKVPRVGRFDYEAATPYRQCIFTGSTPEDAVGALIRGIALLARDGSIDPNLPWTKGTPCIQHVIHVLSERLLYQAERRREHLHEAGSSTGWGGGEPEGAVREKMLAEVQRDNEILAALGTSIAALARVRDL